MFKIDDFKVNSVRKGIRKEDLSFLNLSGRQCMYSQGIYGQGIIVAVIDTGVDSKHSELKGRVLRGRNFTQLRSGNRINTTDTHGHGTHVAGSIAGSNVGIAPKAQILPIKVLDGNGKIDIKNIIEAMKWIKSYRANDGKKVSIVSMSISTDGINEEKAKLQELHKSIKDLVNANIAVICSAGNSYKEEIRYPAVFNEVICVGAVDVDLKSAMFSTQGNHVDVCQVGVNVLSCAPNNKYAEMSGTSMSTPIVSGIAALIACKHQVALGETIPEDYLWRNLKMNTKDLGIPGADTKYGVGFCTLQPLEKEIVIDSKKNIFFIDGVSYKDVKLSEELKNIVKALFIKQGAFIKTDKLLKKIKIIF
ncbi:S8 family peptidase [Abyssisolibacter fermentans]|uniref:S8 family peptidase n=1 Tax=Abyssisolibacter fermentans TaxID=1766203 RepID=UPI00082BFBB1|nr:S8 family serine peptidase [Abyssisolibacter fermentans]